MHYKPWECHSRAFHSSPSSAILMPTATAAAVKAPALPAIAATFFAGNFDFGGGTATAGGGGGFPNPANDGTLGKLRPPTPSPVLGFRFQSSSDSRFTHVTALY
mmetsp:Transcript_10777/g.28783  ORF Transcript_10777/g.28783 Transcript_10777/m.28783 type:complete len:104 (+) Transcript_10777:797-1108(+)